MTRLLKRSSPHKIRQVVFFLFASIILYQPLLLAATGSVCFKQACFQPEIAVSQAEKERGLMHCSKISERGGMLFVYDSEVRPAFWMKNMLMPLDFIWLNANGKAVAFNENVPVCAQGACPTVSSPRPIQFVLEIPAGTIQKVGIKLDDQAQIKS